VVDRLQHVSILHSWEQCWPVAMTTYLQGLPSLHPAMLHLRRAGLGHLLPDIVR
jgi:hypothetical protein